MGVVFALGSSIPLLVEARLAVAWIAAVLAFGGLCAVNCILISRWEDRPAQAPSVWVAVVLVVLTVAASLGANTPVALALLTSLGLLLGLALLRTWISIRGRRVLADAVLLTPLLVVALT